MRITDLSHCETLGQSLGQTSEQTLSPRLVMSQRSSLVQGGASGVGSFADAVALATGRATRTYADVNLRAFTWKGFGIAFGQGLALARGTQSAQTDVATGGVGDFVFAGNYTQRGPGASGSYGSVVAFDVPWL